MLVKAAPFNSEWQHVWGCHLTESGQNLSIFYRDGHYAEQLWRSIADALH